MTPAPVLARKTSRNRITLPQAIVRELPDVEYFQVSLRNDEIVLKPVVIRAAGEHLRAVRAKVKALGLTEKDIAKAILRARKPTR